MELDGTTFDYVVVGAGSAGCVLAEALSRNGRYKVAIVEAGGTDRKFFVQMPLGYGKTFYDKSINWNYYAEPDPGLNGQRDFWPRGKLLGGSGSINAMVWIRGDRRDYDDWAAAGNPGWGFEDVLPLLQGHSNTTKPAKPISGVWAAPFTSRTPAAGRSFSRNALSAPERKPAFPLIPISTDLSRKASASTRSTPRAAGACRLRVPSCDPLSSART